MNVRSKLLITGCFFFCFFLAEPLCAQTALPAGGMKGISAPVISEPIANEYVTFQSTPEPPAPQAPLTQTPAPAEPDHQQPVLTLPATAIDRPAHSRTAFKNLYNTTRIDEKEQIRAAWAETFGCDVWRPYYVVKELEKRVCEKASIKLFKLKGKPEFKKGQFFYVFKTRF